MVYSQLMLFLIKNRFNFMSIQSIGRNSSIERSRDGMKHRRRHRLQATVSPLQQRRIQRRRNSFRLACACGMFTGLSVSTALLAHSAQGTHAMFFTQKQAIATFSAARDFPSYDETLAQQACMDARDANDAAQDAAAVLLRMQHLGT